MGKNAQVLNKSTREDCNHSLLQSSTWELLNAGTSNAQDSIARVRLHSSELSLLRGGRKRMK